MRVFVSCLLAIILLAGALSSASAQDPALIPPLAAITASNLTIYGIGDAPFVADNEIRNYFQLQWSPDGTKLAYIGHDLQNTPVLKVIDLSQSVRLVLTNNVAINFPISFTSDSLRVVYAAPSAAPPPEGEEPDVYVDLVVQDVAAGSVPQIIGTFPFRVGCGGGSPFPGDIAYGIEGGGFLGYEVVLKPVPGGIVYSRDCAALVTAVFSPSAAQGYYLKEPIMQASVSPSQLEVAGTKLVEGRTSAQLIIASTDGQTATILPTSQAVERVVWNPTGDALYYSSRIRSETTLPLADAFRTALAWEGTEIPTFQVSLHRVNRADGVEQTLFTGIGYAIGRIIPTPDPNILLFTLVPNAEAWIAAGEVGVLTATDPEYWAKALGYFGIQLYQLDMTTGAATLLASDMSQVTLNAAMWGQ